MNKTLWWKLRSLIIDENGDVDFSQQKRSGRYLRSSDVRTGRIGSKVGESVETFAKRIRGIWVLRKKDAAEEARIDGEVCLI
jgi:hypothetical protein